MPALGCFVPLCDRIAKFTIPEPNSGCLLWTGTGNAFGYGLITVYRRSIHAHRAAYMCVHGAIPKGIVIRHKCDNPACCNVDHLEAGSARDNNRDTVKRGRHNNGNKEKSHCKNGHLLVGNNVSITSSGGRRCVECRNAYTRKRWPATKARMRARKTGNEEALKLLIAQLKQKDRLTLKQVIEIRSLHAAGMSAKELGARYKRARCTIWQIIRGKSYPLMMQEQLL